MPRKYTRTEAEISDCKQYRYALMRRWAPGSTMGFIMLNPSTADANADDPTVRRCCDFAEREGHSAVLITNLFAFRATDPAEMKAAADPIGPENDKWILWAFGACEGEVVAAWGNHGVHLNRGVVIRKRYNGSLKCLGVNKNGHPKHPLYVSANIPLTNYRPLGV